MKNINRFKLLSTILVLAYLLSACSGMAQQQSTAPSGSGKPQSMEVAFTGTVESVSADSITISGQTVSIDAKTMLDPNIKVGDIVKVEAQVSDTGTVLALKVESFGADDVSPTASSDDTSTPSASETPAVTNSTPDPSMTQTANGMEKEIVGVVTEITASSVTVDGVVYPFTNSTEFKDAIFTGDTVKIHVTVNADGTLTVREIEKSAGTTMGDDNSNNNGSGSDDDSNDDENDDDSGSSNSGSGSGG